jgi:hypothetical protein
MEATTILPRGAAQIARLRKNRRRGFSCIGAIRRDHRNLLPVNVAGVVVKAQ